MRGASLAIANLFYQRFSFKANKSGLGIRLPEQGGVFLYFLIHHDLKKIELTAQRGSKFFAAKIFV